MIAGRTVIRVAGLDVAVERKRIKNMYIKVDSADGAVRVSAPIRMPAEMIHQALERRQGWIDRRRLLARESRFCRQFRSGETHYFQGCAYRLRVVEARGRRGVRLLPPDKLELRVRPGSGRGARRAVLEDWYRHHLRGAIPGLVTRWAPVMGGDVAEWRSKRMKTRWGTCNPTARRIWINLELAKKPPQCLEYVVVHELVHLLERGHGARFHGYMDRFLPEWRARREILRAAAR